VYILVYYLFVCLDCCMHSHWGQWERGKNPIVGLFLYNIDEVITQTEKYL
jgi:hypothetical protein